MDKPDDGVEVKTYVEKIDKLIANDLNPRTINRKAYESLKKSLKDFPEMKQLREIVVDENLTILGGHQRIHALKELGYSDVTVKQVFGLTEKQKREFIIKDNTASGEWDTDIIANRWDVEELENWGVPKFELGLIEPGPEAKEDDFDVPEGGIETDIVLGDLFEIGEHRLLCGDSTDSDQVAKLMNGEISEIVFTSPPYNAGGNENIPNSGGLKYETYTDNKSEDDYFDFLCGNINAILPHTKEIFYNIGLIEKSKRSINRLLFQYNDIFKDIIYWNKSTVAPHIQPGIINNKIEFILCFGNGSRKFVNAQFSQGTYWNVIEGPNASGNEFAKIHKATFPLYLPENIITNFTNVNAIVMDCFCGTGTTMVAAHQLNRKCYGMELDPKYCDVIITRMLKLDPSLIIKRNGEVIEWQTVAIGED